MELGLKLKDKYRYYLFAICLATSSLAKANSINSFASSRLLLTGTQCIFKRKLAVTSRKLSKILISILKN